MIGEACFSNAISDSSGRKFPLGEATSESPFSEFWNILRKVVKKSLLAFYSLTDTRIVDVSLTAVY